MTTPTPPRVILEGDEAAAAGWLPEARILLERSRARAALGGLGVFRAHQRLADDAYAFVVVAGGVASMQIVAGPAATVVNDPVSVDWKVPDFLSGAVLGGTFATDQFDQQVKLCDVFVPTAECRRLTLLNAQERTGTVRSRRLAVDLWAGFGSTQFPPQTQYYSLKATLWTGLMRRVVQAVMGFGKPNKRSIYSDHQFRDLTEAELRELAAEKRDMRRGGNSAYEREVTARGRQIRYDYRWGRTHGVTVGADGRLWLVEVGLTRGVAAMLLPMYEKTRQSAFAEKVAKLNDSMGQTLLDTFGGFPTGQGFPGDPDEFAAWRRAGAIQTLLSDADMHEFYQHSAYSSAIGWAFNADGSEAHNTAHGYGADHVVVGYHYAVLLKFAAVKPLARTDAAVAGLRAGFQPMAEKYPKLFNAAMAKLTRISAEQLGQVNDALAGGVEAGFLCLDGLSCDPWAVGTGRLQKVGEGKLYSPSRYPHQPQFKVPEPVIGGLITMDWTPDVEFPDTFTAGPKDFDTVVWVGFRGQQMEWVRMAASSAGSEPVSIDERDGCAYMGAWHVESSTASHVPTMFYTSSIDTRAEVRATVETLDIRGEDLGYTEIAISDHLDDPNYCTAAKIKAFKLTSKYRRAAGGGLASAILVPFGDRSAYYHAALAREGEVMAWEEAQYRHKADATVAIGYRVLINDRFPGLSLIDRLLPECGNPTARRVAWTEYHPDGCSDVADEGAWCAKCDNLDSMQFQTPLPPLPGRTSSTTAPAWLEVSLVGDFDAAPIRVAHAEVDDLYYQGGDWFSPSPDPAGGTPQYLFVTANALGDSTVVAYMDTVNGGVLQYQGGPLWPGLAGPVPCFIGVCE